MEKWKSGKVGDMEKSDKCRKKCKKWKKKKKGKNGKEKKWKMTSLPFGDCRHPTPEPPNEAPALRQTNGARRPDLTGQAQPMAANGQHPPFQKNNFAEEGDNCRPNLDLNADSTLRCFQAVPCSIQTGPSATELWTSSHTTGVQPHGCAGRKNFLQHGHSLEFTSLFESPSVVWPWLQWKIHQRFQELPQVNWRRNEANAAFAKDRKRSAPMPAMSCTMSPTVSVAGFEGAPSAMSTSNVRPAWKCSKRVNPEVLSTWLGRTGRPADCSLAALPKPPDCSWATLESLRYRAKPITHSADDVCEKWASRSPPWFQGRH